MYFKTKENLSTKNKICKYIISTLLAEVPKESIDSKTNNTLTNNKLCQTIY